MRLFRTYVGLVVVASAVVIGAPAAHAQTWQYDTNNNGVTDTYYVDRNDNGTVDELAYDTNENGIYELVLTDDNEDGTIDWEYADFNQNNAYEFKAQDRNGDGTLDYAYADSNENGYWERWGTVDQNGHYHPFFADDNENGVNDSKEGYSSGRDEQSNADMSKFSQQQQDQNHHNNQAIGDNTKEDREGHGDSDGDGWADYNDHAPHDRYHH